MKNKISFSYVQSLRLLSFICILFLNISCLIFMKKVNAHQFYDGPPDTQVATINSLKEPLNGIGNYLISIDGKPVPKTAKMDLCLVKPGKHILKVSANTWRPKDESAHMNTEILKLWAMERKGKMSNLETFTIEFDAQAGKEYQVFNYMDSFVEVKNSSRLLRYGVPRPWLKDVQANRIALRPTPGELLAKETINENGIPTICLYDGETLPPTNIAMLDVDKTKDNNGKVIGGIYVVAINGKCDNLDIIEFRNPITMIINENQWLTRPQESFQLLPGEYFITLAYYLIRSEKELKENILLNPISGWSLNDTIIPFHAQPGHQYKIRVNVNEKEIRKKDFPKIFYKFEDITEQIKKE